MKYPIKCAQRVSGIPLIKYAHSYLLNARNAKIFFFFFPLSPIAFLSDLTIYITRWVSYKKQELLILPEHLGSRLVFGGARVAHHLYFLVAFLCVFILCHVCPMLPVPLNCPLLIYCSQTLQL